MSATSAFFVDAPGDANEVDNDSDYISHFMMFSQLSADIKIVLKQKERLELLLSEKEREFDSVRNASDGAVKDLNEQLEQERARTETLKETLLQLQSENAIISRESQSLRVKYDSLKKVHKKTNEDLQRKHIECSELANKAPHNVAFSQQPIATSSSPANTMMEILAIKLKQCQVEVKNSNEMSAALHQKHRIILDDSRTMKKCFVASDKSAAKLRTENERLSNEVLRLTNEVKGLKMENTKKRLTCDNLTLNLKAERKEKRRLRGALKTFEEIQEDLRRSQDSSKQMIESLEVSLFQYQNEHMNGENGSSSHEEEENEKSLAETVSESDSKYHVYAQCYCALYETIDEVLQHLQPGA